MKKNIILKLISIVFVIVMIWAIVCAITVTGSGFLDLSNIARGVFIGIAIVCSVLAIVSWKCSQPKRQK